MGGYRELTPQLTNDSVGLLELILSFLEADSELLPHVVLKFAIRPLLLTLLGHLVQLTLQVLEGS